MVSVDEARVDEVLGRAAAAGVPAAVIGTAGGDRLVWAGAFDVALADAETAWRRRLSRRLALAGGVLPGRLRFGVPPLRTSVAQERR